MRSFFDVIVDHVHQINKFYFLKIIALPLNGRYKWVDPACNFDFFTIIKKEKFPLSYFGIHFFSSVLLNFGNFCGRCIGTGNNGRCPANDSCNTGTVIRCAICLCFRLNCRIRKIYDTLIIRGYIWQYCTYFCIFCGAHSLNPRCDGFCVFVWNTRNDEPIKIYTFKLFENWSKIRIRRFFLLSSSAPFFFFRCREFTLAFHYHNFTRWCLIAFQCKPYLLLFVLVPSFRNIIHGIDCCHCIVWAWDREYHCDASTLWALNGCNSLFIKRYIDIWHFKSHRYFPPFRFWYTCSMRYSASVSLSLNTS